MFAPFSPDAPVPFRRQRPANTAVVLLMLLVLLAGGGAAAWFFFQSDSRPARPLPPSAAAPGLPATPTKPTTPTGPQVAESPVDPEQPGQVVTPRGAGGGEKPAPTPAPPPSGKPRRMALLVSVQDYGSPELPDLSYTDADVEKLAEVLHGAGYSRDDLVVMTGARGKDTASLLPTAEGIRQALEGLLSRCTAQDLVLVAFSGHGIEVQQTGSYYFCPLGAKLKETDTLVSLNEVFNQLKDSQAGYKLLLADACRNDPLARGIPEERNVPSVTRRLSGLAPPGGIMAFYSCSPGQYAYEHKELGHGVFFNFLIEGLKGEADLDGDREVIREELEAFVKKRVRHFTVQELKREQWPHLMGESNDQRPLVVLAGGEVQVTPERPRPAVKSRPKSVLLVEDFQKLPSGRLPQGWDDRRGAGRGIYAVQKDAEGRMALQTLARSGSPPVILPALPIRGDFYAECEFLLGDWQNLTVRLEGLSLGAGLDVQVDSWGKVTMADVPPQSCPRFNRHAINHLRITREGDIYRVSVNETVVLAAPLPYKGWFDTVKLHLTAGQSSVGEARLYSVAVGLLEPGEEKDRPQGTLVLNEDVSKVNVGKLPEKWDGRKLYKVVEGPSGRRLLRPAATQDTSYPLTLPPLALHGDFFVECEYLLGDWRELWLRLEGKAPGAAVWVLVDAWGNIALNPNGTRKQGQFTRLDVNRLRLEREKDRYIVRSNDIIVAEAETSSSTSFDTLQLYVTGGESNAAETGVFAVKAGVVGPPREAEKPRGTIVLYEDFTGLEPGELPAGWPDGALFEKGLDAGGAAGIHTSAEKDAQLCRVPLAKPLTGDFFVECETALGDYQVCQLVLEGNGTRIPVSLDAWGQQVTLAARAPANGVNQFWRLKPNRLRLERKGDLYTVRLNDVFVDAGKLPFKGDIEKLSLGLTGGEANIGRARIYSVRAGLLEAPR